jgi:hypothetical protein
MRKLLFNYSLYSHPENGNFRVWQKVFLRVDFRFLLIEWVLGTNLLAKGSPWGAPTIPKVSLWSVERIGRSISWSFEFFSRAVFLPTVQAKPAWPVSQTSLTGLSLWAVEKGCWARESLSCYGFFCSKVERLLRCFGSQGGFGEFLDKAILTGLPNRSNQFPLPVWG